ncbi:MAG: NADH-quinone oxidoreductase subunit L [Anaerolineales bacterium]|nr:NADH-quinone oxidoreductase subunit L [Anaerolineales bacterium]
MEPSTLVWLLPVPPLLAFFLIVFFTNRSKTVSHLLGISAALLSFVGSMVIVTLAIRSGHLGEEPFSSILNWFPTGDTWFQIGVWVDPLTVATLFFVAITILMIFIYSVGYQNFGQPKGDHDQPGLPPHGATVVDEHGHKHKVPSIEPMYSRFFAFISLFAFGMYVLVVSNNLLTLFVGWEIMGLCSYLLIGFWYAKPTARAAAIKAFLTTRIGDVVMLLGLAYLYYLAGSLSYDVIFSEETLHLLTSTGTPFVGISAAVLIGLFLFFGTVGKSAQWPLHVWLPDAMEGPTPVSAMIHAATMVSAGVYLVIRVFPIISAGMQHGEPTLTMNVMAFIGAFTGLFAATIALAQNDIKRVLAYSTISQLGYMIAAIGIGAYVAAAFHLFTHAFFKALLFLGSGSVIHGVEHGVLHTGEDIDPQDMFNMGGLRKKMPFTFWTFLIGGLALSGFPFITAGFWSKDEILADAFAHANWPVLIVLAFAALLTAFYTMRQITLTFLGKSRTESAEHAVESKWTMTLPLVLLAVFAIIAGWPGIPGDFPLIGGFIPNFVHEFVGETLAEHPEAISFSWIPLLISLGVSLGGLALGWWVYRDIPAGAPDPLEKPLGPVYKLLKNKYYFDELYGFIFVRPAFWLSETFTYLWLDRTIIDGFLHFVSRITFSLGGIFRNYIDKPVINGFGDFVGESVKRIGRSGRYIQTGRVQQYMIMALIIAFGTLFSYLFFISQP